MFRKMMTAAAAVSLAATPTVAAAQPVSVEPAVENVEGSELRRRGFIIPLLAIVAIIIAILLLSGGDGSDSP